MRNFKNPVLNSLLMEEEILQGFGSVRLVGGESLVSQRTVFSKDSKYALFCVYFVCNCIRKVSNSNFKAPTNDLCILCFISQSIVLLLWSKNSCLQHCNWRFNS